MTNDLLQALKNQMTLLGVDVVDSFTGQEGFSEARVIKIVDAAILECAGARGLLKAQTYIPSAIICMCVAPKCDDTGTFCFTCAGKVPK